MTTETKERWLMCRDSIGNIWIGLSANKKTENEILFSETYQVVRFAGTHKGLLGLALCGPDDNARISGGRIEMFVRDIKWVVDVTEAAGERIRACPWLE